MGILSSFERRLASLEAAIVPVHRETEKLQRLQDNGERTLGYLNHVIGYYHVAERTDKVIREGSVTLVTKPACGGGSEEHIISWV